MMMLHGKSVHMDCVGRGGTPDGRVLVDRIITMIRVGCTTLVGRILIKSRRRQRGLGGELGRGGLEHVLNRREGIRSVP